MPVFLTACLAALLVIVLEFAAKRLNPATNRFVVVFAVLLPLATMATMLGTLPIAHRYAVTSSAFALMLTIIGVASIGSLIRQVVRTYRVNQASRRKPQAGPNDEAP